jgi:5-formyltetrahydrofolate cyclo-ligase
MNDKPSLRTAARARRAELARALPQYAATIAAFADDLPLAKGAVVAGYWPVRDEADPRGLMRVLAARGHALALPRIEAKDSPLAFHLWREGDVLFDNHHGIAEPAEASPLISPQVLLVPLLAFDAAGHRLGYGGGYYDRTLLSLARAPVVAVGIAYAGQEVAELPQHNHDHPLDVIVTELGVRRLRR